MKLENDKLVKMLSDERILVGKLILERDKLLNDVNHLKEIVEGYQQGELQKSFAAAFNDLCDQVKELEKQLNLLQFEMMMHFKKD